MATRRGANIGLIIALTIIVGGALVWDRIYRIPVVLRNPLPPEGSLLVIEHGGVPPRTRVEPELGRSEPVRRREPPILGTKREPARRPPPVEVRTHIVADGESLSSIALKFYRRSSRWPEIARANGLSDPFVIRTGQTLQIPGSADARR